MLDDKAFFDKEITPAVAKLVDKAKAMNECRMPLKDIYDYILKHSDSYHERYMALFLFGLSYRWFKDDNKIK